MSLFSEMRSYKNILIRYLIPYLVLLLFPLIIGTVVYEKTLNIVEAGIMKSNLTTLEQIKSGIDQKFSEVDMIVYQTINNPKIKSFQYETQPFQNVYRMISTQQSIVDYRIANSIILDYAILFRNSDVALTPNSIYKAKEFYGQHLQFDDEQFNSWHQQAMNVWHQEETQPARRVVMDGKPYTAITYLQSLGTPKFSYGAVMILIDNSEIQRILSGIRTANGEAVYILDQNKKVISQLSPSGGSVPQYIPAGNASGIIEPSAATGDQYISYITSNVNNWTYVVAQPAKVVLQNVYYIKKVTLIILFITMFSGLAFACILAYKNTQPVQELLKLIPDKLYKDLNEFRDAFGTIGTALSRLLLSNEELRVRLDEQFPYVYSDFFHKLLRGGFSSPSELRSLLAYSGLQFRGPHFAVALLQLRGYPDEMNVELLHDLERKRIHVRQAVQKAVSEKVHLYDLDENQIALLIELPGLEWEESRQLLSRTIQHLDELIREKLKLPAVIAVGRPCGSLAQVPQSFEDARSVISLALWQEHKPSVLWYNERPVHFDRYFYPDDMEVRLMNSARIGDKASIDEILQSLFVENFRTRKLSLPMLNLFLSELWGSIVKLDEQGTAKSYWADQIRAVDATDTADKMARIYDNIRTAYYSICDSVLERKKSHNYRLRKEVIELIRTSFMNPEFSLTYAADQSGMSEAYMSQFVKEQTGITFSDYVEVLRMEKARELLAESELPINRLAEEVGYHSANTFRRAFRKIHGITPTEYKSTREQGCAGATLPGGGEKP